MGKEEIVELVRSEVAKEFGEERIKDIEYFGTYEGEDLNVRVRVEGLADRDEGYNVHGRLFDKFLELGINVLHPIARA
ncbi:MAG: hypothetical protein U9Q68_00170 [Euryarchaeota archaeon]|nr:hypothetical protein [Euryarchaeota archaeon]